MSTMQNGHLINCNSDPFIPAGWSIQKHIHGGQFNFNPAKIKLYLSEKQREASISGDDLIEELKNKKVLNACVLDYLLAHQELIPNKWKEKKVFFWGTIYFCGLDFELCVRCLCWEESGWIWGSEFFNNGWFNYDFGSNDPAALANND